MTIDITCPVELVHFEQETFGEGRRQAYLTFLNESPYEISGVSGRLLLVDGEGNTAEDKRIAFGQMDVPSGNRFVCHLALDGYAPFEAATMAVEEVTFADMEPWTLQPERMKDYPEPQPAQGQARNALISVAGHDAQFFPAQVDGAWLCVCGRYNRPRWGICRRCRRERDFVLAQYTPEKVMARHDQHLEHARQNPPRVIMDGAMYKRRRNAPQAEQMPVYEETAKAAPAAGRHKPRPQKQVARSAEAQPMREKGQLPWRYIIPVVGTILVVVLVVWGASNLAGRMPARLPFAVDYLEVLP